jgi:hypothetical protein
MLIIQVIGYNDSWPAGTLLRTGSRIKRLYIINFSPAQTSIFHNNASIFISVNINIPSLLPLQHQRGYAIIDKKQSRKFTKKTHRRSVAKNKKVWYNHLWA